VYMLCECDENLPINQWHTILKFCFLALISNISELDVNKYQGKNVPNSNDHGFIVSISIQ